MAKDFVDAIVIGKRPVSDMQHGLEVVRILSLVHESLRNGEKPIVYR